MPATGLSASPAERLVTSVRGTRLGDGGFRVWSLVIRTLRMLTASDRDAFIRIGRCDSRGRPFGRLFGVMGRRGGLDLLRATFAADVSPDIHLGSGPRLRRVRRIEQSASTAGGDDRLPLVGICSHSRRFCLVADTDLVAALLLSPSAGPMRKSDRRRDEAQCARSCVNEKRDVFAGSRLRGAVNSASAVRATA